MPTTKGDKWVDVLDMNDPDKGLHQVGQAVKYLGKPGELEPVDLIEFHSLPTCRRWRSGMPR